MTQSLTPYDAEGSDLIHLTQKDQNQHTHTILPSQADEEVYTGGSEEVCVRTTEEEEYWQEGEGHSLEGSAEKRHALPETGTDVIVISSLSMFCVSILLF